MNQYPQSVKKLIGNISKLPGIGEKTAERLAMHILCAPRKEIESLAESIMEMKKNVRPCSLCFSLSDTEVCQICSNPGRDETIVCVVEQPADMIAIEKSGAFYGRYHVLQGVLAPMCGIGPDDIRIKDLLARVGTGKVREVVIATATSVEGESTASYISERLKPYAVKVTRIASGVPMGGDLKYVDQVTLKRALEFRHGI
ncbi:MAG: recombination mediator RecR [Thermodesulfobacteriota bacterium]